MFSLVQLRAVFGAGMARASNSQHNRGLDGVWRAQRVKLQRVAAYRQFPLVCRPGDWPIDVEKGAPR
jgi:hypothetical protein